MSTRRPSTAVPARKGSALGSSTKAHGSTGGGGAGDATNIKVAVRCRPINAEEKKQKTTSIATADMEKSLIKIGAHSTGGTKTIPERKYHFDQVFGMYSRQDEIFELMVKNIVNEAMQGFTCAVFAYGPTGKSMLNYSWCLL